MKVESPPPAPDAIVILANGARAHIRPLGPHDADRVEEGLRRLSVETRRQRFLTPLDHFTPEQIEYLVHPDHVNHLALGMEILPEKPGEKPNGIGVARCVRMEEPDLGEMAIVIIDEWQSQGAGIALLTELAAWSWRNGIRRWMGMILKDNQAIEKTLRHVGVAVTSKAVGGGAREEIWELHPPALDEVPPAGEE